MPYNNHIPKEPMTDHPLTDEECYKLCNAFGLDHVFDNMRRAYDKGRDDLLEEICDAWDDALQAEIECGVKILSENRAEDLLQDYPVLASFGAVLEKMHSTQEDS